MEKPQTGLIFDMDGVLVNSENAMRVTSRQSLMRFGIRPTDEDFVEFTGMGEDRFIGGVAEKYGLVYHTEMKDYAYARYKERAAELVIVFPDTKKTLLELRGLGYPLALASAADLFKVRINLDCIGISEDFFDALVTGSEVKNKKPDPEIFLLAARKLGIPPERCVVTEDALSGLRAAKSAGMKAVAVTTCFTRKQLLEGGADRVVESLSELPGVFRELLGTE